MTYATPTFVLDRYEGTASTDRVQTYLDDAELILGRLVPDLADRVTGGQVDVDLVRLVEAQAVIRHLRNPQGYTSESDGDYSYSRDRAAAGAGSLSFTDQELGWLSTAPAPAAAWGTVRVSLPLDRQGTCLR